jgi:ribosome-binding factor A
MGEGVSVEENAKGLNAARGYLRRELAGALQMKHTPELHFKYDPSVAQGDRIERLLKQVQAVPKADDGEGE